MQIRFSYLEVTMTEKKNAGTSCFAQISIKIGKQWEGTQCGVLFFRSSPFSPFFCSGSDIRDILATHGFIFVCGFERKGISLAQCSNVLAVFILIMIAIMGEPAAGWQRTDPWLFPLTHGNTYYTTTPVSKCTAINVTRNTAKWKCARNKERRLKNSAF